MSDLSPEEEELWAREKGLPAFTDPPVTQYLLGRDKLIQQERKQRSDYAFREALSPVAAEACRIVSHIRFEEQQTIWNAEHETSFKDRSEDSVHPGMGFSKARDTLTQTRLWDIIKHMPKGALLHCHLDAMMDLDWLIDEVFRHGGFHISAEAPLNTSEARRHVPITLRWRKDADSTPDLWSNTYETDKFMSIEAAATAFPDGGREGFKSWLKTRCSLTDLDQSEFSRGPANIWSKFSDLFRVLDAVVCFEPIFKLLVPHVLKRLVEDGIRHVDFRATFRYPLYDPTCEAFPDHATRKVQILQDQIEAFKSSAEGKKLWGAKLIYTDLRSLGTQAIIKGMEECIELKQRFPDLLVGYDVVGAEEDGRPLTDLLPELFWFKKTCAQQGVDIPFYFHAGETLGDGTETDENLYDAILLGTRRIGHGFSMYKHPLLMDMIKDKHILIESCPISNEVLRLTSSVTTHPLPALLARGVPVALCSDDPALMGQGGDYLTHDFWQVLQAYEGLGLEGLASMAENSVRYASFEDCNNAQWTQQVKMGAVGNSTRARRIREWSLEWEKFCAWVVREYGQEEYDEEDGLVEYAEEDGEGEMPG